MRVRSWFRLGFLFLVISPSSVVFAQFQEPSKEELQMTAEPKAPGAAAIYLDREQTTDDAKHFESYHERIKVLTEKGKELATIRVPYPHGQFKVTDIRGRTIHADGTVIPLTATPADLMDYKSKDLQLNTMVFTLPSVEVGSVLEYSLQIRFDDSVVVPPTWEIQQPYFVRKAHYSFKPADSGMGRYITDGHGNNLTEIMYAVLLDAKSGAKVVEGPNRTFALDLVDIPPAPDEDWMPPINTLKWHVKFYFTQYKTGPDFWEKEGKRWGKETEHFIEPNNTLRQAVSEIVSAGDTDDQKVRKIYSAVMKLENTSFTRVKSEAERKKEKVKEIHNAEDVWKQKGGTDDDLALLYVALARIAGLQAYPMQVVNRNRAIFDPNYLSLDQLDDYVAIVTIGGKDILLDPGQKGCPFGMLHWKHTMAGGLRLSASGVGGGTTPEATYQQAGMARVADVTMQADGSVQGSIRFVLSGQEALHWRQIALKNDADEVKKQFNESIRESIPDGIQADFNHFLGLEDGESNLVAVVKISGAMGTATGKRVFLPGLFFESQAKHPFAAEATRTIPIDVHYPKLEQDEVIYHLPGGYAVESSPQTTDLAWPSHATMKIRSSASGNDLTVTRVMGYNYTLLNPQDYSALHDFYQKAAAADQQQVVLTRAPAMATKGN
jgi:Domain of Unknown Function with PDB structure (DUF3857)/Transglutaminase-like superfamily